MVQAAPSNDEIAHGYATATIAKHFPSGVEKIRVENGIIYLQGFELSKTEHQQTADTLKIPEK